MPQGMLGNSEALRRIIGGPVCDLIVKINGPDGPEYETALNKILRREDVLWHPALERNEHGHVIVTVTGLDLTGAQEIERLEAAGCRLSDYAKSCLLSKKKDSYDKNHRLVANQAYKVALMPGKEIPDADRTTQALRKRGMEKYGYGKPLGGLIPRIRESVSDKQMEDVGIWYIAVLHDPIEDSGGYPRVLSSDRDGGGRWVKAGWDSPDSRWSGDGAFAFPVSASNT
jgi:hypothetical protein